MELTLMYGLCFGSVVLAASNGFPQVVEMVEDVFSRKAMQTSEQLSELFVEMPYKKVLRLYLIAPIVLGGLAWLITTQWMIGVVGAAVGIVIPGLLGKLTVRIRHAKFHQQLVDTLMLLSSSLKAGLSMLQAFGAVSEEMPPPMSQEFGLILKETRMGLNLEEVMGHLKARIPSEEVTLLVTAVLVARETGGDVTHVFSRLVETLRERKKLKEKIKTMTFMAKAQGTIMAILPVAFAAIVYQMNPGHFRFFMADPLGRAMMGLIALLMVMSMMMFLRFSRSPI